MTMLLLLPLVADSGGGDCYCHWHGLVSWHWYYKYLHVYKNVHFPEKKIFNKKLNWNLITRNKEKKKKIKEREKKTKKTTTKEIIILV